MIAGHLKKGCFEIELDDATEILSRNRLYYQITHFSRIKVRGTDPVGFDVFKDILFDEDSDLLFFVMFQRVESSKF